MLLVLGYPNGVRAEALVLFASPRRMRIVLRGRAEDTIELYGEGSEWFAQGGQAVSIDAVMTDPEVGGFETVGERVMTA